jgi:membrane-bound lytic murein transglycosylase D
MRICKIAAAFGILSAIAVLGVSTVSAVGVQEDMFPAINGKSGVHDKDQPALMASNFRLEPAVSAHVVISPANADAGAVSKDAGIDEQVKQDAVSENGTAEAGVKAAAGDNSPVAVIDPQNETAVRAIEKNILLYKDRLKERFSIWLERSGRYAEIMKDVLKDKKMPEELVFLPIVESGFNLNAYSRARAVGPWQFMSYTAKRYGLVIDWWRDERKDPVKSTMAAADYLKDLYQMFGSWKLALAAYNAGEGKISKALKRSGADNYWSLLNTKQIRQETKDYVPRYIAASMIANTPENYGFYNLVYHKPLSYDEVTLDGPVDVDVIARCAGVEAAEIRELNPELRRWSTPANVSEYTIKIPEGTSDVFILSLASIPAGERFSVDKYKVKKGDSLKKIAKRIDVPTGAITALNPSDGSAVAMKVGAIINLPPKGKYYADHDDKALTGKKVSYSKKASAGKKGRKQNAKSKKSRSRRI